MLSVPRGAVLGKASPGPLFYAQVRGVLVDPVALSFAIFDCSTDEKFLTPVQVYPGSGTHAVDLTAGGADRMGIGRFAAAWTVPGDAALGAYVVRWTWQLPPVLDPLTNIAVDSPVQTIDQDFEVVRAGDTRRFARDTYALISDLRAEGITDHRATDAVLFRALLRASAFVDLATQRRFGAYYASVKVNGRNAPMLLVDEPIIGLDMFVFEISPIYPAGLAVEPDFFRIYNRHLSGLVHPDDRDSPRLELFSTTAGTGDVSGRSFALTMLRVPFGQQNVFLRGVFGYTAPDGSPFGVVPAPIRRACMLLALRDLPKLVQGDAREDAQRRPRILSEGTRDQNYSVESARTLGLATGFTGDPEIDQLLTAFRRTPKFGAV